MWCRTYGGLPTNRVFPLDPERSEVKKFSTRTSERFDIPAAARFAREIKAAKGILLDCDQMGGWKSTTSFEQEIGLTPNRGQ